MKQFVMENILTMSLSLMLGFTLGMGGFLLYSAPKDDSDEYFCFKGAISISPQPTSTVIWDQMVCAKDWTLSNMYGPVGVLQDELDKGNDTKINFKTLEEIKRHYQEKIRSKQGLLTQ